MVMILKTLFTATGFTLRCGWEMVLHIPGIIVFRRQRKAKTPMGILLYSEYGDEVNGIARSTRELMTVLHDLGKQAIYLAPAHSTRNRLEWETPAVAILPQAVSMDTPGYPGAEMAFPRLRPLLEILKERRITHVDILTPSMGSILIVPIFRAMGLTLSCQYRTDIFAYGKHLGIPSAIMAMSHFCIGRFLDRSSRIGVPSIACFDQLAIRYPHLQSQMTVLRRGIPLGFEVWRKKVEVRRNRYVTRNPEGTRRFFFLGRLSREKNLDLLAKVWQRDSALSNCSLTFIGDGPYLQSLTKAFAGLSANFVGVVAADQVANHLCEMDFLVFPSGTDTLGQAVLESHCMGIPALVSNQGGPQELVKSGENGFVLPIEDVDSWSKCIRHCAVMEVEEYMAMSKNARKAVLTMDPKVAAEKHWKHWEDASQSVA
jgi:glycosyltransferase involved in cell wall biosynthesis